jgi:hypothetical protein
MSRLSDAFWSRLEIQASVIRAKAGPCVFMASGCFEAANRQSDKRNVRGAAVGVSFSPPLRAPRDKVVPQISQSTWQVAFFIRRVSDT